MEKYKSKREVIQDFQQQVMQMERSLSSVNNDESKKLQEVQILQKKIASLSNEIEQLHSKKERAKKSVSRCAELFHKKVGANAKDALPEEKDFAIRKARELASVTLQEVSKLVESVPDISPVLEQLLENVRIDLLDLFEKN